MHDFERSPSWEQPTKFCTQTLAGVTGTTVEISKLNFCHTHNQHVGQKKGTACKEKLLRPTVTYSGRILMLCGCFLASGLRSLMKSDGIMNSALVLTKTLVFLVYCLVTCCLHALSNFTLFFYLKKTNSRMYTVQQVCQWNTWDIHEGVLAHSPRHFALNKKAVSLHVLSV